MQTKDAKSRVSRARKDELLRVLWDLDRILIPLSPEQDERIKSEWESGRRPLKLRLIPVK